MAERVLSSLPPVRWVLEYRLENLRQEIEDGVLVDKADIVPEAMRLETDAVKPVLTYRQIQQRPPGDITNDVAHQAYASLVKDGREFRVVLDTSVERLARVELTPRQQQFFTNFTEAPFKIHRRVALRDQRRRPDAPDKQSGDHVVERQ